MHCFCLVSLHTLVSFLAPWCRGLVDYAAPLCYLYAEKASCAAMFCSMYARFWCRLHTIDGTAGKDATLVSLCVLFLHLLEVLHLSRHLSCFILMPLVVSTLCGAALTCHMQTGCAYPCWFD